MMTTSTLSQVFSWIAIVCSVLAAISTGLALHYRTASGKQQTAEINRLKPRSLSEDQKARLQKLLSEREGSVGFIYRLMDGEGHDYTNELANVFSEARWRVLSNAGNSLNDFSGYMVVAVSNEKLLADLQFVQNALSKINIDCRTEEIKAGTIGGQLDPDRVWIIVGRKG